MENNVRESIENILISLQKDESQVLKELEKFKEKNSTKSKKKPESKEVIEYKKDLNLIRNERKNIEDFIKISIALNELRTDEKQIEEELNKYKGKYETKNGKFSKTSEAIEYDRDLKKVRKEIERKELAKSKIKLANEELFYGEEFDRMIEDIVKEKKYNFITTQRNNELEIEELKNETEIEEIEEIEEPKNETEIEETEEIEEPKNETEIEETEEIEEPKNELEIEEIEEMENEPEIEEIEEVEETENEPEVEELEETENQDEIKNEIEEYVKEEIEKIDSALEAYEILELEIKKLNSEELMTEIEELQSDFGKINANRDDLLRKRKILETITDLLTTDFTQGEKEYAAYKDKSKENEDKLNEFKEKIENTTKSYKNLEKKVKEIEEKNAEKLRAELDETIEKIDKINEKIELMEQENIELINNLRSDPKGEEWEKYKLEFDLKKRGVSGTIFLWKNRINHIRNMSMNNLQEAQKRYNRVQDKDYSELCEKELEELSVFLEKGKKHKKNITEIENRFEEKSEDLRNTADSLKDEFMEIQEQNESSKVDETVQRIVSKYWTIYYSLFDEILNPTGKHQRNQHFANSKLEKGKGVEESFLEVEETFENLLIGDLNSAGKVINEMEKVIEELKQKLAEEIIENNDEREIIENNNEEETVVNDEEEIVVNEEEIIENNEEETIENNNEEEENTPERKIENETEESTNRKNHEVVRSTVKEGNKKSFGKGIKNIFSKGYNLLDKLADRIVPIEPDKENNQNKNKENDQSEKEDDVQRRIDAGDEEYNGLSSYSKGKEFRKSQRIPEGFTVISNEPKKNKNVKSSERTDDDDQK